MRSAVLRRRGQGFTLLALAAVCALVGVLVASAGSSRMDPSLAAGSGSPAAKPKPTTTAPSTTPLNTSGWPSLPSGYQRQGLTASPIVQTDTKAKLRIDIPKISLLADLHLTVRPKPNPLGWVDTTGRLYVGSPPGSSQPFGIFPPTKVSLPAFGILPTTATVNITQIPLAGGGIEPLDLSWALTTSSSPVADGAWYYADQPHMGGEVDIRISDVAVDEIPLEVGPDCHTSVPATMSLTAPSGRYKSGVREPPNLFLPYDAHMPNVLAGTTDIPPFTGCHNGAEDLDPLFTAMVSGNANPITVQEDGIVGNYIPPTN